MQARRPDLEPTPIPEKKQGAGGWGRGRGSDHELCLFLFFLLLFVEEEGRGSDAHGSDEQRRREGRSEAHDQVGAGVHRHGRRRLALPGLPAVHVLRLVRWTRHSLRWLLRLVALCMVVMVVMTVVVTAVVVAMTVVVVAIVVVAAAVVVGFATAAGAQRAARAVTAGLRVRRVARRQEVAEEADEQVACVRVPEYGLRIGVDARPEELERLGERGAAEHGFDVLAHLREQDEPDAATQRRGPEPRSRGQIPDWRAHEGGEQQEALPADEPAYGVAQHHGHLGEVRAEEGRVRIGHHGQGADDAVRSDGKRALHHRAVDALAKLQPQDGERNAKAHAGDHVCRRMRALKG
mmetsp:Transcript_27835/g.88424  ORF Transcript_27835/g.88424 Transcript_27835/m.88424 type:complete len:350 (+) Transcript_27835:3300-4349(+)